MILYSNLNCGLWYSKSSKLFIHQHQNDFKTEPKKSNAFIFPLIVDYFPPLYSWICFHINMLIVLFCLFVCLPYRTRSANYQKLKWNKHFKLIISFLKYHIKQSKFYHLIHSPKHTLSFNYWQMHLYWILYLECDWCYMARTNFVMLFFQILAVHQVHLHITIDTTNESCTVFEKEDTSTHFILRCFSYRFTLFSYNVDNAHRSNGTIR